MTIPLKEAPGYKITLLGTMFKYIQGDGVYLSSSNAFFNLCTVDLYSNIRLTSAISPSFQGTPIKDFVLLNINSIELRLPKNIQPGNYDIIYCNPASYAKASDSKQFDLLTITP